MPNNVFGLRESTLITNEGEIELAVTSWRAEDCDIPVEIIFDELDISDFETPNSFSESGTVRRGGTLQLISRQFDEGRYTYIGKIAAIVRKRTIELPRRGRRDFFYFELRSPEQGHGDSCAALPVGFNVRVPTAVSDEGAYEFRSLHFQVRGDPEHRFEIGIKIWTSGDHRLLAPSTGKFIIAGIIWTMPRLIPIIQECGRAGRTSSDPSDDVTANFDACVGHIRQRLQDANAVDDVLDEDAYSAGEADYQEQWVRTVVKHLSGLPYERAQRGVGGSNDQWRSHLMTTGIYPPCNVCDQLGDIIQWIRGVPREYMGAGFQHRDRYIQWSQRTGRGVVTGAQWFADDAAAMENIDLWAKPGASIFFHGDPNHESTIVRTRGSGRTMLVQLFDYGSNISGPGILRGYAGNLKHVAQESSWIPIENAIHNIPQDFWGVGWCPCGTAHRDPPVEYPLATMSLTLEMRYDPDMRRECTRTSILEYDSSRAQSESVNPLSGIENRPIPHLMYALSALPHSEIVKATFIVENTGTLGAVEHQTRLLTIENTEDGSIDFTPFPDGNPWSH